MTEFNFNRWNTILGWFAFLIALITYSLTVEPTMSFWDCGEYIATSAYLEVGHPPGAPLFQMMGAFFSIFAPDRQSIALMVNMLSVLSSAFTILFLFWSSNMMLKKIVGQYSELNQNNLVAILGSSFVGALTFTFSDSFWFSAVEAEVYAMATMMIALLLWLGLRWEQDMDTPRGNRWLVVIALVVGLSFGVHFMALLTLPSIGFIYFFKRYEKITVFNFIVANIIIVAILLFIFKLLLPYTLALFGKSEIFFVNTLGMPFDSGTIIMFILIVGFFIFGLRRTKQKGQAFYNTILLCLIFILIGFSTWLMLPIRANANTPINENKPSDAAEVLAYYNREQYGVNPLFYGPQYTDTFAGLDPDTPYLDKKPNYERDYKTGKYVIVNNYKNAEQNSDDAHKAVLPRLWSTEHVENYMNFTHPPEFTIDQNAFYDPETDEFMEEEFNQLNSIISEFKHAYASGKIDNDGYKTFLKTYSNYLIVEKPSTFDNISFMVEYQFGYMYLRYLLWNFVGRQNDIQGKYDDLDGNWLSGITFMDELHLGPQSNLPKDMATNKGRNTYFFLPFILGLIGLMYHIQRDKKSFYVLLVLFLFTGLALKIYLNERPFEPRERDYAVVGSFYVFAMWVGFGVYAIYEMVLSKLNGKIAAPLVTAVCLLASPILMASQNWDDHDRSNRRTAVAMAKAYLDSCEPNAILYTIGDNDTFPLWYMQEVEGYRTDVKVCCTSLLMTDWYIDQMKMKTYKSDGLPISFEHKQYVDGTRDYIIFSEKTPNRWSLTDFIKFAKSENPQTQVEMNSGQMVHFFPTNKVRIPVNKENIIKNKVVNPKYFDSIVPYIDIDIDGNALYKNRLIMLDILNNNNWKRPVYFTGGSFGDDDYLWMKDYLQLDGMAYKLVPVKTPVNKQNPFDLGQIDTDVMYPLVQKWTWGGGERTDIYHDPETRKNSISSRNNMSRLAMQLIKEGKHDKANTIIEMAINKFPLDYYGYYTAVDPFADAYYKIGKKDKARQLLTKLIEKYRENLMYYKQFSVADQNFMGDEIYTDVERYRNLLQIMKDNGDIGFYNQHKSQFNTFAVMYQRYGVTPEK